MQHLSHLADGEKDKLHEDVWVQGSTAPCFDLASEGCNGAEYSRTRGCGKAIRAPLTGIRPLCATADLDAFWSYTEYVLEEENHNEMESDSLANRISGESREHVSILW